MLRGNFNYGVWTPRPQKEAKAKDVTISIYYGTYNNCVAVMISDAYHGYTQALREVTIGEVLFHYNNGNSIIIYKDK